MPVERNIEDASTQPAHHGIVFTAEGSDPTEFSRSHVINDGRMNPTFTKVMAPQRAYIRPTPIQNRGPANVNKGFQREGTLNHTGKEEMKKNQGREDKQEVGQNSDQGGEVANANLLVFTSRIQSSSSFFALEDTSVFLGSDHMSSKDRDDLYPRLNNSPAHHQKRNETKLADSKRNRRVSGEAQSVNL
jgi:hypothetical protein